MLEQARREAFEGGMAEKEVTVKHLRSLLAETKGKDWDDFKAKIAELRSQLALLETEKHKAEEFTKEAFANQTQAEQQLFQKELELEEIKLSSRRANTLIPKLQTELDLLRVRNEDLRELLDIYLEDRQNTINILEVEHPDVWEKLKRSGKLLEYDLLRAKAKATISERLVGLVQTI